MSKHLFGLAAFTQLSIASRSLRAIRLPKNVIRLGTPCDFAFGMASIRLATMRSWFAGLLRPSRIDPPPPYPIEQTSPWSRTTLQSGSSSKSIAVMPSAETARHNSGSAMFL